jgi:hypothetical protein
MKPRALLIYLLSPLLLTACGPDDPDKDSVAGTRDKCPTVAAKTKDGCPAEKNISAVHFYLETSASMGGYYKGNAFRDVVSDLVTKIDKNIHPVDIFYTAERTEKFNGSPQQFSSEIARVSISPQKSSQLHKIIEDIAAKNESGHISLLVSDCILSFPDADIRRDREINRNNASSTLKSNIFATFADLRKRGIGASIYAFKSPFNGTYYDYQNNKTQLNGTQRPFYVWVIGEMALLQKFNAQLRDISSFRPEKELHFGGSESAVATYDIIPQVERQGSWMKTQGGIKDVKLKKGDGMQAALGVDLSALPAYAQEVDYLQENLQVQTTGCTATITVKKKSSVDRSKLKSQPQIEDFEKATHIFLLKVSDMPLAEATVTYRLPLRYDTWYTAWSCMDDKNLAASCAERTFGFEHLVNGVREAYEAKNNFYVDGVVKLSK